MQELQQRHLRMALAHHQSRSIMQIIRHQMAMLLFTIRLNLCGLHQIVSGTSLVVQAVLKDWHSRILRVHHIHRQVQFPHRLFLLL
nr:MAG TPA: hypothetical protein [Caudoviricetes sp.]